MPSRRIEYWIEWVDGSRMIADYPEAARRGGFTEQDISKREGLLDVCPPEHYTERRRFPNRETAIGWARKNQSLDLWKLPRLSVVEVTEYRTHDETEEVELWDIPENGDAYAVHVGGGSE